MTDTDPRPSPGDTPGRRAAPGEVWAEVRSDYLSGHSANSCCRRHGVSLSALRSRAAREGWRRADHPWVPPNRLHPLDEGVMLEEEIGGDLSEVAWARLVFVCDRRMKRAVLRGDAADALRWRRLRDLLQLDDDEDERATAQERALLGRFGDDWAMDEPPADVDSVDSLDGVFPEAPEAPDPGEA